MMTSPISAAPGRWHSDLDLSAVFSVANKPQYPFYCAGTLYWIQAISGEGGRNALLTPAAAEPGESRIVLPAPYDIRTAVNEYGGACHCVHDNTLIFNNYSDGGLYQLPLVAEGAAEPECILPGDMDNGRVGFADLCCVPGSGFIIAVMEVVRKGLSAASLVAVNLHGKAGNTLTTLADADDFYACARVNEDGTRIAWISWNDPCMPWDQTQLNHAELVHDPHRTGVMLANVKEIDGGREVSINQAGFDDRGRLLYVRDSATGPDASHNFWNLFVYDESTGQRRQLTHFDFELGEPHWQFGQHRWQAYRGDVLAIATDINGDQLLRLHGDTGEIVMSFGRFASLCHLHGSACGQYMTFVAGHADQGPQIFAVRSASTGIEELQCLHDFPTVSRNYSIPTKLAFPTDGNEVAYAYYYRPCNPHYAQPLEPPPAVVMVHGGPTGRTSAEFAPIRQYFCSLGFAVLDIDHRGSSGYGRRFRQRLLGNWGQIDCADIKNAVTYCVEQRLVDGRSVFIRGGSAGGYAVLRSITRYPKLFCAGASYYGIGNLITLAGITHRFEAHYTDRLIGEKFDIETAHSAHSEFTKRSPIFHCDELATPMILFQGNRDKVTPPALAREMLEVLSNKGVRYQYVEYVGEGHGFRKIENKIDALTKETEFFADCLPD